MSARSITIVGGNVAGLSAAYYLASKGVDVTVYESRIWDKPCGGAISLEFARFLDTIGIAPEGADHFIPNLRFAFTGGRTFDTGNFFVIVSRHDLQRQLIAHLQQFPNVAIVFQRVSARDTDRFTPQTIVATGFGGFSRQVMGRTWDQMTQGLIFRFDGRVPERSHPQAHLMIFDSRIKGYGWVFIGKGDHVNVGLGGVGGSSDRPALRQAFFDFFDLVADRFGYHVRPADPTPAAWKIPLLNTNWNHPVSWLRGGIEFIGVGDVLGLAHPIIGAGIEPAWQSGWLLGESYDPDTGRIDTDRYAHLLKKNLQLTSRKPIDRLLTALLQSRMISDKDGFGYHAARMITPYLIRKIKQYPWFSMVHDGVRKTGYALGDSAFRV